MEILYSLRLGTPDVPKATNHKSVKCVGFVNGLSWRAAGERCLKLWVGVLLVELWCAVQCVCRFSGEQCLVCVCVLYTVGAPKCVCVYSVHCRYSTYVYRCSPGAPLLIIYWLFPQTRGSVGGGGGEKWWRREMKRALCIVIILALVLVLVLVLFRIGIVMSSSFWPITSCL